MACAVYLDFDLEIQGQGRLCTARVLRSPVGEAKRDFKLPFSNTQVENYILRLGPARRSMRGPIPTSVQTAEEFGGRLFAAIFDGEMQGCFQSSLATARSKNAGLRIRLHLTNAPHLANLPWEYLYNKSSREFLVLSDETPLVRYLELQESIQPLGITPPLRILVMVSSPNDYDKIDVEQEYSNLEIALGELIRRKLVALERLDEATLVDLQNRLRPGRYHIFYFIGHGGFDEKQGGTLILKDEAGRGHAVSASRLGTILHDHRSLRLAIINACESALPSRKAPYAGTAQNLVKQGLPAVVAMQFAILVALATKDNQISLVDISKEDATDIGCFDQAVGSRGAMQILLRGSIGEVESITFSPSGDAIAAIIKEEKQSELQKLYIWGTSNGKLKPAIGPLREGITRSVFSPKGGLILAISGPKAFIYDFNTGRKKAVLGKHYGPIKTAVFSPDEKYVVTVSDDGMSWLWETRSGKKLHERRNPRGLLVFHDKRNFFPFTFRSIFPFNFDKLHRRHLKPMTGAVFNYNSSLIVTTSEDGMVKLWDARSGDQVAELKGHAGRVNTVAFSPDGKFVLTAGSDHTARVWDICKEINKEKTPSKDKKLRDVSKALMNICRNSIE